MKSRIIGNILNDYSLPIEGRNKWRFGIIDISVPFLVNGSPDGLPLFIKKIEFPLINTWIFASFSASGRHIHNELQIRLIMPETPSISWDVLFSELVRFVATKVRDRSTAEDIVQEVFIKVYTKASQIKEADRISGWIYQVTRNAVADHFRQRSKVMEPVNVDWESAPNDFNDCVARCLTQLMSSMPEKYRVPLQLVEVDNLSQYEVAEKLNISYSGARSRIQRGRKILKQKLDELYDIKTDSYGNILSCEDKIPYCCVRKC